MRKDAHGLPVGRVEQSESAQKFFLKFFLKIFFKKFFPGSYYRVAGGVRFTTFLKENFEILSAMEDYRRKVFVIESIGEFQKEILEGKFIGWEEIFVMCFYGIIYLKFGAGEKGKKFF